LVVGLLLMSVGVFVGLVHRLSRLQIESVLRFTGDFGRRIIEAHYPPLERPCVVADAGGFREWPVSQTLTYSGPPRAIQSLDLAELSALAENSCGVIEMKSAVGDTLVESTPVLFVYGAHDSISKSALWRAIKTGSGRTFEQDPKYPIRLLVDIAIRALSPAVNDPTTAVLALMILGLYLFDPYAINRNTGSLILIDQDTNNTVGAGMILYDGGERPHSDEDMPSI